MQRCRGGPGRRCTMQRHTLTCPRRQCCFPAPLSRPWRPGWCASTSAPGRSHRGPAPAHTAAQTVSSGPSILQHGRGSAAIKGQPSSSWPGGQLLAHPARAEAAGERLLSSMKGSATGVGTGAACCSAMRLSAAGAGQPTHPGAWRCAAGKHALGRLRGPPPAAACGTRAPPRCVWEGRACAERGE